MLLDENYQTNAEYDAALAANLSEIKRLGLSADDVVAITHIEYHLRHAADGLSTALALWDNLPGRLKETPPGKSLEIEICEAAFYRDAERAMLAALGGGACKMSKSGQVVIFSAPHCGRRDLSGIREIAERQLQSAGIILPR